MKTMLFALALCGVAFAANGTGMAGGQEVEVYVVAHASVPPPLMYRATTEASEMLGRIGVRLEWKAGRPHPERGCHKVLALVIEDIAPANLDPGVYARTNLGDGSITVFYDRLHPMRANWPGLVPTFLAHVFAHEIAHALQGVSQHSETGLMKPHWTFADYHAMQDGPLPFTPFDVGMIRAGIWRSCPTGAVAQ